MRSRSVPLVLAAAVAAASFVPAWVRAGNDDEVPIGNEAALTGGAVVATISDGSAAWYNPAGIAAADRNTLDASASLYALRHYRAPRFISATSGERSESRVLEILTIPSSVTHTRRVGDNVNLALGLFVPKSSSLGLRELLDASAPEGTSEWILITDGAQTRYHLGAGVGIRVSDSFRLGVSLFGVFETGWVNAQFFGETVTPDGAASLAGVGLVSSEWSIGLELRAGLQWDPIPELSLGLSVSSPVMSFVGSARGTGYGVDVLTGTGPGDLDSGFDPSDDDVTDTGILFSLPARVRLGGAYRFERGYIAIEGDIQHPLEDRQVLRGNGIELERAVDRQVNWGVRAGGRFDVTDTLTLGAGFFTDRSAEPPPRDFSAERIHYYGMTFGLQTRTVRRLHEEEEADDLVFMTTLALRYAHGRGHIGGLEIDLASPEGANFPPVDIRVNELAINLGTAVLF